MPMRLWSVVVSHERRVGRATLCGTEAGAAGRSDGAVVAIALGDGFALHEAGEVCVGDDTHGDRHGRMAGAAELGALPLVDAGMPGLEPRVRGPVGEDVRLL